jgi:hypothetical protein
MSTRKVKDAVDIKTNEVIYFKGHAKATYMTNGTSVEDAINLTDNKIESKQDIITDLDVIRSGAIKGETALQSVPSEYITETELNSKNYATASQLSSKQDKINDLDTIRSGAAKGATALQSVPAEYITETELNAKGYLTEHQDISGKVDKVSGKGLSTNDYTTAEKTKLAGIASGAEVNVQSDWNETNTSSDAYIKNKPTIPAAVTETTVSNWGFTKNTGTYSKPNGGIPKSDLSSTVQTSLGKADTALQSIPSEYATTGYVDNKVAALVNGAPETLDTLDEIAAALKDNADIVDVLNNSISKKQDNLVSGDNIKTIGGITLLGSGDINKIACGTWN